MALVLPVSSFAQVSVADQIASLQAQIAVLTAQLQVLRVAIATSSDVAVTTSDKCFYISRTLYRGLSGEDVRDLQNFLRTRAEMYWPADVESTGYFGVVTEATVRRFQVSQGIASTGIVEETTTKSINAIVCGGTMSAQMIIPLDVDLRASPPEIFEGGSLTLSWTSMNLKSCSASGSWSGTKATAGAETFVNVMAGDKTYILTCTDGGRTESDRVTVRVFVLTSTNQSPKVNAGADQNITLPATANLSGTASDDGLPNPPSVLSYSWSKIWGPGTVMFGTSSVPNTTASFSAAGTYVLRLTASDGVLTSSDDLSVVVTYTYPSPPVPFDTGYALGAYYMPKPNALTHQWYDIMQWNRRTDVKQNKTFALPLLGYPSGDDTEAMDWNIKWAVEHGLSYFIFEDFWAEGDDKPMYSNTDTFINAQYKDYLKFAVMLNAIDVPNDDQSKISVMFTGKIAETYKNRYFTQSNYLRINGKPAVVVFNSTWVFRTSDPATIKQRLDEFEKAVSTDVYWIYATPDTFYTPPVNPINIANIKRSGFDALQPYGVFPHQYPSDPLLGLDYQIIINHVINRNKALFDQAKTNNLGYIPTATINFDERPGYFFNPHMPRRHFALNPTLAGFKQMLIGVKQLIDLNKSGSTVVAIGGKPTIGLPAWNEWFEGHELEPGVSIVSPSKPFGVLDAVDEVFASRVSHADATLAKRSTPTIVSQDKWNFGDPTDLQLTYLPPGGTALKPMGTFGVTTRYRKIIRDSAEVIVPVYFDIAANVNTRQYHSITIPFRADCMVHPCTKSVQISWGSTTYSADADINPASSAGENYRGTVGKTLEQCGMSDDARWMSCEFELVTDPNWKGKLDIIRITFHMNAVPTAYSIGTVRLAPNTILP